MSSSRACTSASEGCGRSTSWDATPLHAHGAEIRACLETIPASASVAATSALVPHLAHRREIYLLERRRHPDTEYIAVDTYTWIYPLRLPDVKVLLGQWLEDGYGVVCSRGGTAVLRRGATSRSLSRELREQLAQSG